MKIFALSLMATLALGTSAFAHDHGGGKSCTDKACASCDHKKGEVCEHCKKKHEDCDCHKADGSKKAEQKHDEKHAH